MEPILSDALIRNLSIGAVVTYAAAAGVVFLSGRVGHWPLTGALFLFTLAAIVLLYMDGFNWHRDHPIALAFFLAFMGIAVWRALAGASAMWAMTAVVTVVVLQCLFLIGVLAFNYVFKHSQWF